MLHHKLSVDLCQDRMESTTQMLKEREIWAVVAEDDCAARTRPSSLGKMFLHVFTLGKDERMVEMSNFPSIIAVFFHFHEAPTFPAQCSGDPNSDLPGPSAGPRRPRPKRRRRQSRRRGARAGRGRRKRRRSGWPWRRWMRPAGRWRMDGIWMGRMT